MSATLDTKLSKYPHHNRHGFTLIQTCDCVPEQYDVYKGKQQVGYLRLRHGYFYASQEPGGEQLYDAEPDGDGMFEDYERDYYLDRAVEAIKRKDGK